MSGKSGYTAAQLMAMQRDAAERVREMQRRARQRMEQTAPASPPQHSVPAPCPAASPPVAERGSFQDFPASLLRQLDSDRMLILLLLLVLSGEDVEPGLKLALLWLLL